MSAPEESKKRKRSPLLVAFVTVFLDLVGFGIIIPIQPFLAETFGATATVVTILGGTYSFMQFIFAPIWGRLSDRVGRRPIILFGIFASIIGYTIFGFAETLTLLFISRAITGFGNANIATAQAVVSDVTDASNRAKGMGIIGAAFGLGFIFGPALGGWLGQYDPSYPAFGAAILGTGNLIMAFFLLPETLKPGSTAGASRRNFSLKVMRETTSMANVPQLLTVTLISIGAFAVFEQVISLYIEHAWLNVETLSAKERVASASRLTAIYLVCVGLAAAYVQGRLIGKLSKKYGELKLGRIGLLIMGISVAATPYLIDAKSYTLMIISGIAVAFGTGLCNPSMTSLLSRSVPDDRQGGVLGLNQSIASLGRVLGPLVSGAMFQYYAKLPLLFSGGVILLAIFATLSMKQPDAPKPAAN